MSAITVQQARLRGKRSSAGVWCCWALVLLVASLAGSAAAVGKKDVLTRACGGAANLTARYKHATFTPLLQLYRAGGPPAEPCALLKLSCRLLSNARQLTVADAGVRNAREPFGGNTWAELLTHAVLARSPRARGAISPQSGGAVLRLAVLAPADVARVPATCVWPDGVLVGHAQAFVPGVHGATLRQLSSGQGSSSRLSGDDVAALAALLIADALTLNRDRAARRNMFARADGRLIALDLTCPECWKLTCPAAGAFEQHARRLVRAPNFLLHGVAAAATKPGCAVGGDLGAVLAAAQQVAVEACGTEPGCDELRKHLEHFAAADPWFSFVTGEAERLAALGSAVAPLCCSSVSGANARGAHRARACQACAGPFHGAGVHLANAGSCFSRTELQLSLGAFLAADAARRVAFLLHKLHEAPRDCGTAVTNRTS
jgi:hypothetical protein